MTPELRAATEELYKTFSIYTLSPTMSGCPCCVPGGNKEKLHTRPLRELEDEDISTYAFKAMTTWGNVSDFKHFLPRIFELLASNDLNVDAFVVLGKLPYGKWESWEAGERTAVRRFLLGWWNELVKSKTGFDKEIFYEIYRCMGNLDVLLREWTFNFEDNSFRNFIAFVTDYFAELESKNKLKAWGSFPHGELASWMRNKKEELEKGFYYYEKSDPSFAGRISDALYVLENTGEKE